MSVKRIYHILLIFNCLATLAYTQILDWVCNQQGRLTSTVTQAGWKLKYSCVPDVEWRVGARQQQLCYCVNKYLYIYLTSTFCLKILRYDFWSICPSPILKLSFNMNCGIFHLIVFPKSCENHGVGGGLSLADTCLLELILWMSLITATLIGLHTTCFGGFYSSEPKISDFVSEI